MPSFFLQKLAQQRKNQYDLLKQRIEREKAMFVVAQKIQTRKDLLVRDLVLVLCFFRVIRSRSVLTCFFTLISILTFPDNS